MRVDDPDVRVSNPGRRERRIAVLLFLATLVSVYLVYGYQWTDGDPLGDAETAWESAQFAGALMAILLAHEMGHYWVARRHGFDLSLPYFLPFPMAFGTFGAIIRLRSLPPNRTALLEMGAAGPLAGFVVAVAVMALGLPETVAQEVIELPMSRPAPVVEMVESQVTGWAAMLEGLLSHPPLSWVFPPVEPETLPLLVLANPPVMDVVGSWVMGAAPGRYDLLGPLALAGWVGCLLTAINLVPIGQLDGGHVLNALAPRWARRTSQFCLALAMLGGLLWPGWVVWGVLLLVLRAWISLPVPATPALSRRARWVAVLAGLTFLASFMPSPVEVETLSFDEIRWLGDPSPDPTWPD